MWFDDAYYPLSHEYHQERFYILSMSRATTMKQEIKGQEKTFVLINLKIFISETSFWRWAVTQKETQAEKNEKTPKMTKSKLLVMAS